MSKLPQVFRSRSDCSRAVACGMNGQAETIPNSSSPTTPAHMPVAVSRDPQLFIDDYLIAQSANIVRKTHAPKRASNHPQALPDYDWADCRPVSGNGLELPVEWRRANKLPSRSDNAPAQLEFELKNAALYGYQIVLE
jgi:hypothetical protein